MTSDEEYLLGVFNQIVNHFTGPKESAKTDTMMTAFQNATMADHETFTMYHDRLINLRSKLQLSGQRITLSMMYRRIRESTPKEMHSFISSLAARFGDELEGKYEDECTPAELTARQLAYDKFIEGIEREYPRTGHAKRQPTIAKPNAEGGDVLQNMSENNMQEEKRNHFSIRGGFMSRGGRGGIRGRINKNLSPPWRPNDFRSRFNVPNRKEHNSRGRGAFSNNRRGGRGGTVRRGGIMKRLQSNRPKVFNCKYCQVDTHYSVNCYNKDKVPCKGCKGNHALKDCRNCFNCFRPGHNAFNCIKPHRSGWNGVGGDQSHNLHERKETGELWSGGVVFATEASHAHFSRQ